MMPRALPLPPPGFDDLSVEEKLDYVQSLWDRVISHPEEIPVPEWHHRIIEERLMAQREDPAAARPGEEVRQEVIQSLKAHRERRG